MQRCRRPRPSRRISPSSAFGSSREGPYISGSSRKALYAANFAALAYIGHSKDEIEALEAKLKFAPLNYATAAIGVDKVEKLKVEQLDEAYEKMRQWCRERKPQEPEDESQDVPEELENF